MATPGSSTSEFKLTQLAVGLGVVLEAAGGVLSHLDQGNKYVAIAVVLVGGLLQVLSVLGYTKSRTAVKIAETASSPQPPSPTP